MKRFFYGACVLLFPVVIGLISCANETSGDSKTASTEETAGTSVSIPEGLHIVNTAANSISLSWNESENALSYKVYYALSNSMEDEKIIESNSTTYTITGLTTNTTYFFRVSGYNNTISSEKSSITSGKTIEITSLSSPSGLSISSYNYDSISLIWNSVTDANGYEIYYGYSDSSSSLTYYGKSTSASFTVNGLSELQTYYFCILAYNGSIKSERTNTVSATTPQAPLPAPTGLAIGTFNDKYISIKWNAVAGATGYKVYYGTNSYNLEYVKSVTTKAYAITGLTANTTYYFAVKSYNSTNESELSSYISQTTSSTSTGGTSGGDGGSSTEYTFYKRVTALKLTVINSNVTKSTYETVDIYKKGTKYYHKYKRNGYNSLQYNNSIKFLGVDVSSYRYWNLRVVLSVTYYYYFDF